MHTDEKYMRMALALARKGLALTSPNPAVGAVVVKNGRVVGRGYHKKCGAAHAEVNALNDAGGKAKGATLYVTLEPCNHFGRTPPCTDAIIAAKIVRVVAAMKDPNPLNNGAGLRKLKRRGVKVSVGVLEEEARGLNKPFVKFITTGLPYVTVKLAESIDGKIATRAGDSKWITGPASRRYVHGLRSRVDAVMVGVNTVIKDDPRLTCRIPGRRNPARVIVDSALKTPPGARIFSGSPASPVYIATLRRAGTAAKDARLIRTRSDHGRVDLKELLKKLARLGMTHILVEGGGELVAGLVEKKLVDEFMFFIAPMIIGGRDAVSSVGGVGARRMGQALALGEMKVRRFGKDILIEAEVK